MKVPKSDSSPILPTTTNAATTSATTATTPAAEGAARIATTTTAATLLACWNSYDLLHTAMTSSGLWMSPVTVSLRPSSSTYCSGVVA